MCDSFLKSFYLKKNIEIEYFTLMISFPICLCLEMNENVETFMTLKKMFGEKLWFLEAFSFSTHSHTWRINDDSCKHEKKYVFREIFLTTSKGENLKMFATFFSNWRTNYADESSKGFFPLCQIPNSQIPTVVHLVLLPCFSWWNICPYLG